MDEKPINSIEAQRLIDIEFIGNMLEQEGVELSTIKEVAEQNEGVFALETHLTELFGESEAQEKIEGLLDKYIAWKNEKFKDSLTHPYEMARVNLGWQLPDGMNECIEELELREMALKVSVSTLNPSFIPYFLTLHGDETEISMEREEDRRAIAFQIPLERVSHEMKTNNEYLEYILKQFNLDEYLQPEYTVDDAIHELRERIRSEFYMECDELNGYFETTANYHITGTINTPQFYAIQRVLFIAEILSEDLMLKDLQGGEEEMYKDVIFGLAPFEAQNSKLYKLFTDEHTNENMWGVVEMGGTINHVNNAISKSTVEELEAAQTAGEDVKPGSIVIIERNPLTERAGFVHWETKSKNTVFYAKFANRTDLRKEDVGITEYIEEPTKIVEPSLTLAELRIIQKNSVGDFVSPRTKELRLLEQFRSGKLPPSTTIQLSSTEERNGNAEQPEIIMPDITGYSKIAEVLSRDFDINAEEIIAPFISDIVRLGKNIGALAGNWAGDSLHFIHPRQNELEQFSTAELNTAVAKLSPQERAALFYIGINRLHEQFIAELKASAGKIFVDQLTRLNEVANQNLKDEILNNMTYTIQSELDVESNNPMFRAQAFLLSKEQLTTKKYGLKAVSAKESLCQLRQPTTWHRARRESKLGITNLRSEESLTTADFDRFRPELEKDTNGQRYVVSQATYEALEHSIFKDLFEKSEHGYIMRETDPLPQEIEDLLASLLQ